VKAISSPGSNRRLSPTFTALGRRVVRLSWPYRPGWLDAAWAVSFALGLIAIVTFPDWETVPLHLIWISATLLYGFRTWSMRPTLFVLGVVLACTGTVMSMDVIRGTEPLAELTEVPMMAAMFGAMVWHARRKLVAEQQARLVGEENARLLATQRRFLQDASHQLRTPITIALGHAELLASDLSGRQEGNDIGVILGELTRLRRIAERLMVIAAAEDPEFLHPEPVALDGFIMEVLRRWRPTAERRWQLGRVDKVTVQADRERLGLAIDALLENAVRHTVKGDVIKLSVTTGGPADSTVRMTVTDGGSGMPAELLPHVFDRFRIGDSGHPRGTGLGLALVRAVARAHGGEVLVRSWPGEGSAFEVLLPAAHAPRPPDPDGVARADARDDKLARKQLCHGTYVTAREAVAVDKTWSAALREVARSVARHKVVSGVVGLCVVATFTVIAVIGSTSHAASGLNADGVGAIVPTGDPAAPAFSLPELGQPGRHVSLADYSGRPLIVNFFASWCPPCKAETPMLASFYRTEHGKVALIGMDENDTTGNALAFAKAKDVTYPLAWDPDIVAGSSYDVEAMPQTFFLNASHHIVYRVFGQVTSAELSQGIALATGAAS
jgi:signal transduction histidine kinase/thiol-disulfide isomerase/thioredoxin